ncbi:MAG: hypothetical protein ABI579_05295 [Candidatus Sumerlaeota bacterium]
MTTTTENQPAKAKQIPDFYIFENGAAGQKGGKPAGAAFVHKKGKGFTLLIAGKRYAAFPPKGKSAPATEQPATEGKGA